MHLPDLKTVDFRNPYSISRFVAQMCEIGNDLGMLTQRFTPSPEKNALRRLADNFLRRLTAAIPRMSRADATAVTPAYDLAHRIAYLTPPDPVALRRLLPA